MINYVHQRPRPWDMLDCIKELLSAGLFPGEHTLTFVNRSAGGPAPTAQPSHPPRMHPQSSLTL